MKHIIILGDGMADHAIARLHGKTPLQHADTPNMDLLARNGRTGRLITIPDGFHPGSEVANTAILGYDLNKVYEGRGPLEAASIGYEMRADDLALRCNIVSLKDGKIKNHHGGHLTTEEGSVLIKLLDERLGNDNIHFITGTQYRHLLIIRKGSKHIVCAPPHDHPDEVWKELMVKPEPEWENKEEAGRMTARQTADLINELILKSQDILNSPDSLRRQNDGQWSIWPWGGGYRPAMRKLCDTYRDIRNGYVISAVDLIKGIGHYAGLKIIKVDGATGLADTNYEGKAKAALEALTEGDFVFLHVEASDEAGHDGDLELKLRTIENFDKRIVGPIYNEVRRWNTNVSIAVLPDHPTPVEVRTHVNEPVPFAIWHRHITPDDVINFDEASCVAGGYGLLKPDEFMQVFMDGGE